MVSSNAGRPSAAVLGHLRYSYVLTPRLLHRHHFQQVPAGILEVKPAPAPPRVDFVVCVSEWSAPVGNTLRLHLAKDRFKFGLADLDCIVMALDSRRVKVRLTFRAAFIGEIECQAVVDLNLREVTRLYR